MTAGMKLVVGLLFVIPLGSFGQVLSTKQFTEPALSEGQCHTVVDSKVYLKDLKSTNAAKTAIAEIGAQKIADLSNTADESYYFCKIKCHIQSQQLFLWITQKDRNENFKNLNGFVCGGLDIQDVALSPTLTIKTTVATPFSAVQTRYPEIHSKLKEMSYKLVGTEVGNQITEFFNTMKVIKTAYSAAQSEIFQSAAAQLQTYLEPTPEAWTLIKAKVKYLENNSVEAKSGIANFKTGDDLVNMFFLTNGMFLRYID